MKILALALVLLAGCATAPSGEPYRNINASLREPCPALQPLKGMDGKAVLRWAIPTVKTYEECRAGKAALIEATKEIK